MYEIESGKNNYYSPIKKKKRKNKYNNKNVLNQHYIAKHYNKNQGKRLPPRTTKPITPSFLHRMDKIANERSMIHNTAGDEKEKAKKPRNDSRTTTTAVTIKEIFNASDVAINNHTNSSKDEMKKKSMLRSEILKTVDSALMALFTICDEEHRGAVNKNVLVKRLYTPGK